ncbi:MAG: glycosyltransferase family 2 protein [Candidatus Nanoarchaeia archaeon]
MNKTKPRIAILTLNYNNSQETKLLIDSALGCKEVFQLIILDNNSNKEDFTNLKKIVKNKFSNKIILERSETNLGFAGGFNNLIKKFNNFDLYIIANSDIILSNSSLSYLIKEAIKHPEAVLSPTVLKYVNNKKTTDLLNNYIPYTADYKIEFNLLKTKKTHEKTKKTIKCSETAFTIICIPKKVFKKIGLLDSNNFFFFNEDADFFHRMHSGNIQLYYVGAALTWHPAKGASGKENKFLIYHRIKGYIIFFRKYKKYLLLFKYLCIYLPLKLLLLVAKPNLAFQVFKATTDGFKHKLKDAPRL